MAFRPEFEADIRRLRKINGGGFLCSPNYNVFGSETHRYKLNRPLTEPEVAAFERKHHIELPIDYREFITRIGNGGMGPAYGLLPLYEWETELDINSEDFLAKEFSHQEGWNESADSLEDDKGDYESERYAKWEESYFDNRQIVGSIRICHYGCAIYYILVVSGGEKGQVWVDDRANSQGVYPVKDFTLSRLTFTNWYQKWMDETMGRTD